MTLLHTIGLKTLQRLKDHPLRITRRINDDPIPCTITGPSGGLFTVSLPGFDPTVDLDGNPRAIFPGSVVRIQGGASNGYYLVSGINPSAGSTPGSISIDSSQGGIAAQTYGFVTFFDFDFDLIVDLCRIARSHLETYADQSFSGIKPFTEYREGSGTITLILRRRRIRTIDEMNIYAAMPAFNQKFGITPSDIDLSEAQNSGILRITPQAASSSVMLSYNFISERYFPKAKIQVVGTYGWDESEIPSLIPEVMQAIEYYAAALILTEEMSRSDNMNSFTREGYSQSNDVGRDIEAYKGLAYALITPFTSGEAGS